MSLYVYYKEVDDKSCSNKLLKAFDQIYEAAQYNFEKPEEILRRFVNCFSKGFSNMKTEQIKVDKQNRKKKKERQFRHTK